MTTADFANAATYNMEERYTAYTKGSQTPSTPQTPSGTTVPPSGARIRLCIEADQRAAVCWTRWSGPTAGPHFTVRRNSWKITAICCGA